MTDFKRIDNARKILGFDERATLSEIKNRYRKLALKYHPDRCKDKKKKHCEEMIKKINYAYEVIMNYCASYNYSFKKEDAKGAAMDKEFYAHLRKFYDGWLGDIDYE